MAPTNESLPCETSSPAATQVRSSLIERRRSEQEAEKNLLANGEQARAARPSRLLARLARVDAIQSVEELTLPVARWTRWALRRRRRIGLQGRERGLEADRARKAEDQRKEEQGA